MYKKQILNSLIVLVLNLCFITISSSQFEQVFPNEYVSSIEKMKFHDSGLAIALLECDGILRSTDHGNSWVYVKVAGMASQSNILFIDDDPKKIMISGSNTAYRSDDGGLTFMPFSYVGIPTEGARRFIIQLQNGDFMLLSRTASAISKNLISWTKVTGFPAFHYASEGPKLFCTASRFLMRSLDNVTTFDTAFVFATNILGIDYKDETLIVALLDNTIFKSIDNGNTFTEIVNPFQTIGNPLILDKNTYLFIAYNRLAITRDGGATFEIDSYTPNHLNGIEDYAVADDGSIYVYGESLKMLKSSDLGDNWDLQKGYVEDFISIGSVDNFVAAGGSLGSIVYSSDDGMTWRDIPGERGAIINIQTLSNGNILYLDNSGKGHIIDQNGNELSVIEFEPSSFTFKANDGRLLLVSNLTSGMIMESKDNGISWNVVYEHDDKIASLDIISNQQWILVLATGSVNLTNDGGTTWEKLHEIGSTITQASFKSSKEGLWFSGQKMFGTDDGFQSIQEAGIPYNAISLIRIGGQSFCFGGNSSNTFMYEFTSLLSNKAVKTGCVAHNVVASTPTSLIIAGRGSVIERYKITPTSSTTSDRNPHLKLAVYPNPTSDRLFFEDISDGASVSITNVVGNSAIKTVSGNQIDIADLLPGVYFVLTVQNGKTFQAKFCKI